MSGDTLVYPCFSAVPMGWTQAPSTSAESAFCVWKKDGQQRLVLDARLANCYFDQALPVELGTGPSCVRVEADGHAPIEVGGVDIAVAFYAMQLPREDAPFLAGVLKRVHKAREERKSIRGKGGKREDNKDGE